MVKENSICLEFRNEFTLILYILKISVNDFLLFPVLLG